MIRYTLKIDVTGERELYSNIVFTAGDARGYRLDFSFYNGKEKISTEGCALSVKAKRADGAVVIDSGVIRGEECYWVAADNAYSVGGSLELEVALSKTDGTFVTTCVIFASVREGFGEKGLASSNNEPILAKLSAQSLSTQAAVSAHKTDAGAHAEVFERERLSFNPLYSPAFIDEKESDTELLVSDAVDTTPIALSVYGACTESLPEGVTEKSLDSPAIITGVGESGSVTVMVTDSEGVDTEIEIPLDSPFYGIRHPETGEWLARDEIRVENGKVTLTRNVQKYEVDSTGNGYIAVIYHGSAASAGGSIFAVGKSSVSMKPGSAEILSVMSPQLKTARTYAVMSSLHCGYEGDYDRHFILTLPNAATGIVADDTATQKKEKFIAWLSEYNATSDIPLTIYAICQPTETDITDTDAGKLLLALSASGD
ncbi:MAG: hypothetical protein IJB48_03965, partial [Clostridia bacterium]|nr:hypothetical protein [Clostridia bacterium]